jgi:hypothetical protein
MNNEKFVCERCGHDFNDITNFRRHLNRKNVCKNKISNISIESIREKHLPPKKIKDIPCPSCNKMFSTTSGLNIHYNKCCTSDDKKRDAMLQEIMERKRKNGKKPELLNDEKPTENTQIIFQTKEELDKHIEEKIKEFLDKRSSEETTNTTVTHSETNNDTEKNNIIPKKYKKKNIPHAVKIMCWNSNIGELVSKTKCMCCFNVDITQHNFHCGHIMAECHGGSFDMSNLLPICNVCNYSMGSTNMNEFRQLYGFNNNPHK